MVKYDYILLDIDKPHYIYNLPPNSPLILSENAEVGVKNIFFWYTFPNISKKYNNNKIKIYFDQKWITEEIPEGMYDFEELNNFFNLKLGGKINIKADNTTFKCVMTLQSNIKVDFSASNLYKLLGFEPKIYEHSSVGNKLVDITRGVDKIFIRCNIVERPYQNEYRNCLYDLLPIGSPGAAIFENIDNVEYHKCKDRVIRQIEIRITDANNQLIVFSETLLLKLVFRH